MDLICAQITITLGGIAILESGDEVDGVIETNCNFQGEDLDFIDAEYTEPTARGNQTNTLTFTRWKAYTSLETMQTAANEFDDWAPAGGTLVKGGVTYPKARMVSCSCRQSDVDPLYLIQTFTVNYGAKASS